MTERNGADVVREYMASPNNPMRVLIKKLCAEAAKFRDNDLAVAYSEIAERIEAALADTGELVSRIDYFWMTQRGEIRRSAFEEASKHKYSHGRTGAQCACGFKFEGPADREWPEHILALEQR